MKTARGITEDDRMSFIKVIVPAHPDQINNEALYKIRQAAANNKFEIPDNALMSISGDIVDLSLTYQVRWRNNGSTIYLSECTFVPGVEACRFGMFRDSVLYNQGKN